MSEQLRVEPMEGLPEVLLVTPRVFRDERGFFLEAHSARRYRDAGVPCAFVQDSHSFSRAGVVRGFHFQLQQQQAKLVTVISGRVFDVAVDVRRGSPTLGRWVFCELDGEARRQLFIPAGFAHGFCALQDSHVLYKSSDYYAPEHERGIAWDDPQLAVPWPVETPLLSARDRALPRLAELAPEELPAREPRGAP